MTAAEWGDLARLAQAFDPRDRTWHLHAMDRLYVGPGEPGNLDAIFHTSGEPLSDLTEDGAQEARRVAEFIAAANPATILRLLRELTNAYRSGGEAQIARDKWADLYVSMRAERDALAARLAAVREVFNAWDDEGLGSVPGLDRTNWPDAWDDLRAALAAPTDTTKEN